MPGARKRNGSSELVGPLLEQAGAAFHEGRFEDAVASAERALEVDPRSAEARHFRAASLLESGRTGDAQEEFERALKLAPDDPEILLGFSDLLVLHPGEDRALVERGVTLAERGAKLARKADDPELEFEFLLLQGTAFNQLGECERALGALEDALKLVPDAEDAALERAIALFELCRFGEAERAFKALLERAPDNGWAHHYLGLIAERRKDAREARRWFQKAESLSPEDFPPAVRLDDEEFDRAVEAAIAQLPAHVREYLDNATIAVEPIPSDEDLTSSHPPLSPCILGVFRGTPVGERSVTDAWSHATASIVLYQRNLERFAKTRAELVEQIGITVMHEVGHLIGLDEDDLWERGLE